MTANLLDHGPVCTAVTLEAIVELTEDGLTARQIAAHLSIGLRSVQKGQNLMGVRSANSNIPGLPVDEVAVMRAADGDRVVLHHDERAEAIALLLRRGKSHTQIAATLGISARTVQRHVTKARCAA